MGKISDNQLSKIKKYYYFDKLSMREIAEKYGVSTDAIVYYMRKHDLKRRNFYEINRLRFENKVLSFKIKPMNSLYLKELKAIGAMLYWGEGYKSVKGCSVDLANSDPEIILIFLKFLRKIYGVDEQRLRVLLYCYEDQDINELIRYWSEITKIPKNQFSKPYVRKDFNIDSKRKMKYGLVHIRYSDKKLLLEIKKTIDSYRNKYIIY